MLLTAALLALPLTGGAAAQDQRTALLAGSCQGCHGVAGAGAGGIPSIAQTMSRADFVAAMQGFRANARPATVMGRIARGYTDEEFALLAALYAQPETRR